MNVSPPVLVMLYTAAVSAAATFVLKSAGVENALEITLIAGLVAVLVLTWVRPPA